ncbi:MAG: sulfurtransferase [Mycobacterium sp.]|nr:sulfurtransferase [Mycobacterium sp.]
MNAIDHFTAKLACETDPSDVAAALAAGRDFVLIDSRSDAAWERGHVRGAVHLPTAQIADRAGSLISRGTPVVTYCWGPGCNGATRAALAFAKLGYPVREMIGGYEYWVREGLPVDGAPQAAPDPLTTVVAIGCDC